MNNIMLKGYWLRFVFTTGVEIGTIIAFGLITYICLKLGISNGVILTACTGTAILSVLMTVRVLADIQAEGDDPIPNNEKDGKKE